MNFYWYHVNADGTADRYDDSPELCERIDSGEPGWFGSPEGAIVFGGVQATAYTRKVDVTYDAAAYINTREMRETGRVMVTTVTAEPNRRGERSWSVQL